MENTDITISVFDDLLIESRLNDDKIELTVQFAKPLDLRLKVTYEADVTEAELDRDLRSFALEAGLEFVEVATKAGLDEVVAMEHYALVKDNLLTRGAKAIKSTIDMERKMKRERSLSSKLLGGLELGVALLSDPLIIGFLLIGMHNAAWWLALTLSALGGVALGMNLIMIMALESKIGDLLYENTRPEIPKWNPGLIIYQSIGEVASAAALVSFGYVTMGLVYGIASFASKIVGKRLRRAMQARQAARKGAEWDPVRERGADD